MLFRSLIYSYFRFAGAQTLTVVSPIKNAVVHEDQIEVTGKTNPDATIVINNQSVGVNENGSFDTKISLTPGLNTVTIVASNKFKRQTVITRNLRLEK